MGLATEFSPAFLPLCILLGMAYAGVLYYLDIRKGLRPWTHRIMLALRFLSVTLIAILLLGPMFRKNTRLVEKPVVVIGVDNSRSMVLGSDSAWTRKNLQPAVAELEKMLQKSCDVRVYSFGSRLVAGFNPSFLDPKTDISAFFNEVETRFANRNAAALVLFSDGIYNEGTDPWYAARKLSFPIYTVALGDTAIRKDILVKKVVYNRTAFKGDRFPVEAYIGMDKCAGVPVRVSLWEGNRMLESREIRAGGERAVQKVSYMLEAGEKGIRKYRILLDPLDNEANAQNNSAVFSVEVLDARQQIAIVHASPHPDIGALRKALEGSARFETELVRTDELPASFGKYDLVILNQVPSVTSVAGLDRLVQSKTSLLFILGSQSDINAVNQVKQGLIVNANNVSFSESVPVLSESFTLFSLDRNDREVFRDFPPLQSPFGIYQFSPLTDVLFYQKINNISTQTPLVMFTRAGDRKVGFIAGENIWRWRMASSNGRPDHEAFDRLIEKMAVYLASRDDKDFFRIRMPNRISENLPVEIEAEVYNASYEPVNDPDVNITITDEGGRNYPFMFGRTSQAYFLNAGLFPVGEYRYQATVKLGSVLHRKEGRFLVEQVNVESTGLVADHNLLYRLAVSHDGEMTGRDGVEKLAEKILSRDDIRPVSSFQQRMSDLVGNPWVFVVILGLMTAEWVIRKREGL